VFVFAKLWRRAEVLTDVELIELRYAGRPAAFLRGFRALYVAVVMNSIIIGWVVKAMVTVLDQTVFAGRAAGGHADFWLVASMLAVTGAYGVLAGMWGVALTDAFQFVLAMAGCIALAAVAVGAVGGVAALEERVVANFGSDQALRFLPDFTAVDAWMPAGVFACLVLTQWWATWYPGAEPGGGGYIVQRMASCRDERHAVRATLFFQIAHYCLRPWPWVLVAFAALALHPEVRAWATAAPDAGLPDPGSAYPMLIRELAPSGLRGLLLVTFGAAAMSTISTQMNWGASYLVNDVYRRFLDPHASDRRLVLVARLASALVLALGGLVGWFMVTRGIGVDTAWAFLAALGAGVGTVFILRWFWWRVSAWSEIAAMVGSLAAFAGVRLWQGRLPPAERMAEQYTSLLVALLSAGAWLVVTFATRPEPRERLVAFYRKVRPDGPGWRPVAALAPDVRPDGGLGIALVCVLLGTAAVWLTLPGIGAVVFGRWTEAATCLGGAAVAVVALLRLMPRTLAR
ncbi:MAG TPA: sodium:proline symporter, partial [Planctomycetota bacterium]|nr:sodium:proline symporter [Planctomycetota bacterium]